ncbi:zf-HC2 domain-containing protein [Streptomyces sp. NPDC003758]|uniref:Zf-HC2 domain-containing protein n=1 Tax=Streptomyces cynarae TaxID=2981134 RepID=A0ABY6E5A5_9ACTN|nr:zf-HC2 domain-containing protein [Streptomyces cynarae]UXY21083.1 zf-HC2 domain-containing protein [Streptomyces cynarae]
MPSDVTCEKVREIGAELALGVLPGRERAGAVAHLDRCADCREYVAQLTLVGDRLIGLLPCGEPPVGFETRVAQALTRSAQGQGEQAQDVRTEDAQAPGAQVGDGVQVESVPVEGAQVDGVQVEGMQTNGAQAQGTPAHEGRSRAREAGIPRQSRRGRRVRLRVASAVAALALAFGFGGWAVGTAIEELAAGPSNPAGAPTGMLRASLVSARAFGKSAGEIYAHPGPQGWLYMSVDLADAGTPYDGKVSCLLVRHDGSTVRVGELTLHKGYGYWAGPAPVDASTLAGARLAAPDGTVLATAQFGASGLA